MNWPSIRIPGLQEQSADHARRQEVQESVQLRLRRESADEAQRVGVFRARDADMPE